MLWLLTKIRMSLLHKSEFKALSELIIFTLCILNKLLGLLLLYLLQKPTDRLIFYSSSYFCSFLRYFFLIDTSFSQFVFGHELWQNPNGPPNNQLGGCSPPCSPTIPSMVTHPLIHHQYKCLIPMSCTAFCPCWLCF